VNKISRPSVDDVAALSLISNNAKLKSYPVLKWEVPALTSAYKTYETGGGNVLGMPASFGVSDAVERALKSHYRSPPKELNYIKQMRYENENKACPMCGSFFTGTLDHVLPRKHYGLFSILSINLVPACKCNSKRGEVFKGTRAGQRVLHPYFDACLADRLIKSRFEDPGKLPKVSVKPAVPLSHQDYAAIEFHLKSVVEKNSIIKWLRERWIKFCRKPSLIVRQLKENPRTHQDLICILSNELDLLDEAHESKNNWESIFVMGLLEDHIVTWIWAHMNSSGRAADGPLV
jgi:hypothetical protein